MPDTAHMECIRPSGDGLCSDDACPCGYPGATIPRGSGYLYISEDVVEFRRDAPSLEDAEKKIQRVQEQMRQDLGAAGVMFTDLRPVPLLICETAAKKRGLDLAVAAADAKHFWETGRAPLRPTPLASEGAPPPPPPLKESKVGEAGDAFVPEDSSQQHTVAGRLENAFGPADREVPSEQRSQRPVGRNLLIAVACIIFSVALQAAVRVATSQVEIIFPATWSALATVAGLTFFVTGVVQAVLNHRDAVSSDTRVRSPGKMASWKKALILLFAFSISEVSFVWGVIYLASAETRDRKVFGAWAVVISLVTYPIRMLLLLSG